MSGNSPAYLPAPHYFFQLNSPICLQCLQLYYLVMMIFTSTVSGSSAQGRGQNSLKACE